MKFVKVLSLSALAGLALVAAPAEAWWTSPPFAFMRIETPRWMSWYGGLDFFGSTAGAPHPNVLIHVADVVHTPVGSSAAGMITWQPDPEKPPELFGFIAADDKVVGPWLGPQIFAGTPFELARTSKARITITRGDGSVSARLEIDKHLFELTFAELGPSLYINRGPTPGTPFYQNGIERSVGKVTLTVDGKDVPVTAAPLSPTGGPGAVYSEFGSYAR
ncbi:MAG: hypothetical protein U1F43_00880 [Myxococcota bacterium]